MPRKTITVFLIITLMVFFTYNPVAAQVIPLNKLAEAEEIIYGSFQEDAIINRIANLEKTIYDKKMTGSLIERSERIVNYVLPTGDKPSLVFMINTLEWALTNNISNGQIHERLDRIEEMVFGQVQSGAMVDRIKRLLELSLPEGKIPVEKIVLPADTLMKIKLLDKISSLDSHVGDKVSFSIVNDIIVEGNMIIPANTRGYLRISSIDAAGKMGKDGDVKLSFSDIIAIDGSKIAVKIDEKSQNENRSKELAIGASVLGSIILGPVGLIAGFFVQGDEEEVPAGTELFVQTENSYEVYSLVLN